MDHNVDHAKRYNHILYQTRFWLFIYFLLQSYAIYLKNKKISRVLNRETFIGKKLFDL